LGVTEEEKGKGVKITRSDIFQVVNIYQWI